MMDRKEYLMKMLDEGTLEAKDENEAALVYLEELEQEYKEEREENERIARGYNQEKKTIKDPEAWYRACALIEGQDAADEHRRMDNEILASCPTATPEDREFKNFMEEELEIIKLVYPCDEYN